MGEVVHLDEYRNGERDREKRIRHRIGELALEIDGLRLQEQLAMSEKRRLERMLEGDGPA